MKRLVMLLGCCALLLPLTAPAVDFNLQVREPGPGHRARSYWWKFDGATWELSPSEKFTLTGGGEMRLQKADQTEVAAVCRQASSAERDMLKKKDPAAQDAYFRALLPAGTKDLKLVSRRDNPLPVNGLTNIEFVYTYELGAITYRAAFMVNRAVERPDKKDAPQTSPREDFFTVVVVASQENQAVVYEAVQQMLATARIAPKDSDTGPGDQYVSHGMLGR